MKRFSTPFALLPLLALCALSCSRGAPPPATAASPSTGSAAAHQPQAVLGAPEWLPSEAREMLSSRMQRHGEEMMLLLISVMTLQHEDSELLAQQVAAEPRLGRPAPGESGTISSLLPPRFFDLQEELQVRARSMAEAARSKDDTGIVRAYGQLAETCVSCHSVYLNAQERAELPGD